MVRSYEPSQTYIIIPCSPADCRKAIVDGDGLEKLVSFLGNKDCSDLHVLALSVLSLCLDDAESMVALQSSGCLQQLLQHITSSTSPDMKQHAARTLAKAATNSERENFVLSDPTKQKQQLENAHLYDYVLPNKEGKSVLNVQCIVCCEST